jgi:late competence protein required for DNA uptake (superfamily II DNA/RNA helicase)
VGGFFCRSVYRWRLRGGGDVSVDGGQEGVMSCLRCGADTLKQSHTYCPECRAIMRKLWNGASFAPRVIQKFPIESRHPWRGTR